MTIGHSTLPLEAFLRALKENGCRFLVDVRRYPGSRRYPHFSQKELFASLEREGITAVWREGLGGRRPAQKNSINLGAGTAYQYKYYRKNADGSVTWECYPGGGNCGSNRALTTPASGAVTLNDTVSWD